MQHLGEAELTCCVPSPHNSFVCSSLRTLGLLQTARGYQNVPRGGKYQIYSSFIASLGHKTPWAVWVHSTPAFPAFPVVLLWSHKALAALLSCHLAPGAPLTSPSAKNQGDHGQELQNMESGIVALWEWPATSHWLANMGEKSYKSPKLLPEVWIPLEHPQVWSLLSY